MPQAQISITNFQKWMIFTIISTGTFMSLLSATSINVALPLLAKEFGAPLSGIQWVVTGYFLVISSILPIFGWAGDMTQRKYVIALGFAIFGIGGLLCSQSTSLSGLIIARLVQGIGASMNMANSYAAITGAFPANQRGRALGMQGSMVALGSISGPAVGGLLLDFFGWHSIFYITLPFALIGCLLSLSYIPKVPKRKIESFDFVGAITLVVAIALLTVSLSQFGRPGWSDTEIAVYATISILLFLFFHRWEKRHVAPLVDIHMFSNKVFLSGNLAGLSAFLALNSNNMLLPFYLHDILGLEPRAMGMVLMVFPIMVIIAAPLSGSLSDRYGAPRFAITGMALMTCALLSLVFTIPFKTVGFIVASLALFGISNGMFQSPNNSTTLAVIPVEKHGMAGSIVALMRNFGAVVGIALSVRLCDMVQESELAKQVLITTEIQNDAFIAGMQAALLLGAFFAFIGLIFSLTKRKNLSNSKDEKTA